MTPSDKPEETMCDGCGETLKPTDVVLCEECDAACPCFTLTKAWCPVHEREWDSATTMIEFIEEPTS